MIESRAVCERELARLDAVAEGETINVWGNGLLEAMVKLDVRFEKVESLIPGWFRRIYRTALVARKAQTLRYKWTLLNTDPQILQAWDDGR